MDSLTFSWCNKLFDDAITEFDDEKRIFHLTAKRPINIKTNLELADFCTQVKSKLSEYAANKRCYMIVDVSNIVIDPLLVSDYMQKIGFLCDHYLYPEGLARYGFQITRITATIGHQRYLHNDPHLFRNKADAMNYIEGLIRSQKQGKRQKTASP